jgi:hypothetical protein
MNKTKRFQPHQVEATLIHHFPYCPKEHREQIKEKVLSRDWHKKTSLVKAISIAVHTHIRHHMTEYEWWLKQAGITRDEARVIVKPDVDDWFEYWSSGNDASKPNP